MSGGKQVWTGWRLTSELLWGSCHAVSVPSDPGVKVTPLPSVLCTSQPCPALWSACCCLAWTASPVRGNLSHGWCLSEPPTPAWHLAQHRPLLKEKNENIQHSGNFDLRTRGKRTCYIFKIKPLFLWSCMCIKFTVSSLLRYIVRWY